MKTKFDIRNKKGNVKVVNDSYSINLLTTRNGYQWIGMEINRELAKEIIATLNAYLESELDKNDK